MLWRDEVIRLVLGVAISLFVAVAFAAQPLLQFDSPDQELRYRSLIDELRCLVCQNQNLADSNAELAQDLRDRTYTMIREGASDNQIVDYMVERYGSFVLYKPPLSGTTIALWFGPAIILALAIYAHWRHLRRRRAQAAAKLSEEQQARVKKLLD